MRIDLNNLYHIVPPKENNKIVFSRFASVYLPVMRSPAIGFKFVLEGEEQYTINNRKYNVKAQQFLLVNAFQPYTTAINTEQSTIGLCVDVNAEIMSNVHWVATQTTKTLLDNGCLYPRLLPSVFEQVHNIRDIATGSHINLLTNRIKKSGGPDKIDQTLFYELAWDIVCLDETVKEKFVAINCQKPATKTELYRRVLCAKTIIDDNPTQGFSLDQLASQVFLSKFHLLRIFKQLFGTSPHRYQIHKKMEAVARLLLQNNETIEEIAQLMNFPDAPTLCKAFKQIYGCTPGQYRIREL